MFNNIRIARHVSCRLSSSTWQTICDVTKTPHDQVSHVLLSYMCFLSNVFIPPVCFWGKRFSKTDVHSSALLLKCNSIICFSLFWMNPCTMRQIFLAHKKTFSAWVWEVPIFLANHKHFVPVLQWVVAVVGGDIVLVIINNDLKACCQNIHKRVIQIEMKGSLKFDDVSVNKLVFRWQLTKV